MGGVSTGLELEQLNHLMHCANNCRQMLHAIDRKLKQALDCLENGETTDCREMLAVVSEALPQAIAIIDHRDEGLDTDSVAPGVVGDKGR